MKSDASDNRNILPSRFVLGIKKAEDGTEILKARLIIGGQRDKWKDSIVYITNTVKHRSVRIIMALAALFRFDVWSTSISSLCKPCHTSDS
jgi:hypothetical protein